MDIPGVGDNQTVEEGRIPKDITHLGNRPSCRDHKANQVVGIRSTVDHQSAEGVQQPNRKIPRNHRHRKTGSVDRVTPVEEAVEEDAEPHGDYWQAW